MTSPFDETAAPQFAILSKEALDAIALLKGHDPVQPEKVPMAEVCPVSTAALQTALRQRDAQAKAEEESLKGRIGKTFFSGKDSPNKEILVGQYTNSLGQTFNILAAPQNMTDASGKKTEFKYEEAKNRVAELNGINYADDKEFFDAVADGSYNNALLIPPRLLLDGLDDNGKKAQAENLCSLQAKLDPSDKFSEGKYWSSTPHDTSMVKAAEFPNGVPSNEPAAISRCKVRLIRLVPA